MTAMWIGAGGCVSSFTEEKCKALADLGVRNCHVVVPDLGTYDDVLERIHRYGMTATYDLEIPMWVNIGMNAGADTSWAEPRLKAVADAGWDYFSQEGGGKAQINRLRKYLPFINYGSEDGADMYAGQYSHDPDAHFANILESYHKWAVDAYVATAKVAWSHSRNFGITFQMYEQTSDLETDLTSISVYFDRLEAEGITISEVNFWSGCPSDVGLIFGARWQGIIAFIARRYGISSTRAWATKQPKPPTPTPTQKIPTALLLDQSNATPAVNEPVTFIVTLKAGPHDSRQPLAGKTVRIWHDRGGRLYTDAQSTTDSKGQLIVKTIFKDTGSRRVFAAFDGDDQYLPSGNNVIQVL